MEGVIFMNFSNPLQFEQPKNDTVLYLINCYKFNERSSEKSLSGERFTVLK